MVSTKQVIREVRSEIGIKLYKISHQILYATRLKKDYSGSCFVPTPAKTHELRTRQRRSPVQPNHYRNAIESFLPLAASGKS
jgi:hypothetical protein